MVSFTKASSVRCFTAGSRRQRRVGGNPAIIPSIAGWAVETGLNTITIDDEEDPFAHGFVVR
jgi:proline racemase